MGSGMRSVGERDWARTDFYAVLGLDHRAGTAEIDAAYRRLAKELHPDTRPDDPDAADRFAAVARAREILGDPRTRRAYDASRAEIVGVAVGPVPGPARPGAAARPARRPMPRGLRIGLAIVLTLMGAAMATWAAVGHIREAAQRQGTVSTRGAIAEVGGRRRVVYATEAGERRSAPVPDRVAGGTGRPVTVRYRPGDPGSVVIVQSRLLVDLTIGIAAAKLLLGGVLLLVYPRLRVRFASPGAGTRNVT